MTLLSESKPRILLLTTGGTITMLKSSNGALQPCEDADRLIKAIPELSSLAEIEILPIVNIDSSNFTPSVWLQIAKAIFQRIKEL